MTSHFFHCREVNLSLEDVEMHNRKVNIWDREVCYFFRSVIYPTVPCSVPYSIRL